MQDCHLQRVDVPCQYHQPLFHTFNKDSKQHFGTICGHIRLNVWDMLPFSATDDDQSTLKRKLDRKLICITQQTLGTKKCWGLPLYPFNEQQQKIAETEGMRKVDHRGLAAFWF